VQRPQPEAGHDRAGPAAGTVAHEAMPTATLSSGVSLSAFVNSYRKSRAGGSLRTGALCRCARISASRCADRPASPTRTPSGA